MDKRIKSIPEGMSIFMNYPIIECRMTGIIKAKQNNKGVISIMYEDKTIEERQADFYIEDKTCFEVVRFIQEGRKLKGEQNMNIKEKLKAIPEKINFAYYEGHTRFDNTTDEYELLENMEEVEWIEYLDLMAFTGVTIEYDLIKNEFIIESIL